jgi:hypothetical protein
VQWCLGELLYYQSGEVAEWLSHARRKNPSPEVGIEDQVRALLDAKVPAFSFIYGIPPKEILEQCRRQRILTIGTATTRDEAIALEEAGVDVVVASGFRDIPALTDPSPPTHQWGSNPSSSATKLPMCRVAHIAALELSDSSFRLRRVIARLLYPDFIPIGSLHYRIPI